MLTRDIETAKAFYAALAKWQYEIVDIDGGQYVMANVGERPNGGMMGMGDDMPSAVPAYWMTYFCVDDTDAAAASAEQNGGHIMRPPADIMPGRIAVVADPQGALFAIFRPRDM